MPSVPAVQEKIQKVSLEARNINLQLDWEEKR